MSETEEDTITSQSPPPYVHCCGAVVVYSPVTCMVVPFPFSDNWMIFLQFYSEEGGRFILTRTTLTPDYDARAFLGLVTRTEFPGSSYIYSMLKLIEMKFCERCVGMGVFRVI